MFIERSFVSEDREKVLENLEEKLISVKGVVSVDDLEVIKK